MNTSIWTEVEFEKASDNAPNRGRFLKNTDIPTDTNMILKFVDRLQKDMDDALRQKIEVNGNKVGDIYWVYYFLDVSTSEAVEKEYTAFKKMTALTISMKNAGIEKGDTFTVRRTGSGFDTRFEIVKLNGDLALNAHELNKAVDQVIEKSDAPF